MYILWKFHFRPIAGFKFWKSPRRKVFAVRKSGKKKKHFDLDSFSDSDNEVTSKRTKSNSVAVEVIADKIDDLRDDIVSVKCVMQDLLSLSSSRLGLQRLIRDSFQCKICLAAPITPPVMLSKCCKTIIGCESINGTPEMMH